MSETLSRPKCVQTPAPTVVVEDQIDRVLEQASAPVAADLSAFASPTQVGQRLAAIRDTLDKLEKTEGCAGPNYSRYAKERDALIERIFVMQPDNLHDVAALLGASMDRLSMLEGFELSRMHIEEYTTQIQQGTCHILRFLMRMGVDTQKLSPQDIAYDIQRILGTKAEATPSALRDLADTMERHAMKS